MNELVRHADAGWEKSKALALDSVTSPHSRRAYASALERFLGWYLAASRAPLSKAVVNAYRAHLEAAGFSASTINARLSALRKLVAEAADNGMIPLELAAGIARVRGVGQRGVRLGNWLDRRQAERLIQAAHDRPGYHLALLDGQIQEFLLHRNKGIHAAVDHLSEGRCRPCQAQSLFGSLKDDVVLLDRQVQQDFLCCNKVGGALGGELH